MVDNLAHELQLAFLEIESDHQIHIDKTFMSGGTCQIQNVGPYLKQNLEVAVNRLKQIPAHASLNFETGSSGEVSSAVAIALAIEGLKRPRNPAINLLRGALARQSQTLKLFLEKWSHSLAVAGATFLLLLVWSIMRDSMSYDMANQAYDQMKVQAKNVTGGELKGSRANPRNIRKYIRKKEREAKNRKLAEKVQTITSALDVLKKLTQSTPTKRQITIDIQKLIIDNDKVEAQGFVARATEIETLAKAWKALSKDGKVEKFRPGFAAAGGKTPFGLRLNVARVKGN